MKIKLLCIICCCLIAACAGSRGKRISSVEKTLSKMTVEEKVGQMMVVAYTPKFYNKDAGGFNTLLNRVEKYHIGAVNFIGRDGEAYGVARSIDRLQSKAKIPLMVMADIEWGLPMRIQDGTMFLQNMAFGATGSEEYAYELGKITAIEARALGIQVGFSPVVDVNNNPENVIINTRSFGEDPALVSKLGAAYIRGMQENGVYATAKHFPGHGDTDVDSHLGLPTINASVDRIESVELAPFKAAVDAGVRFVMVAHITYGAFPQMEGRPATLDSYFIEDVLRKDMGYKGLVISDAMRMGGIVNHYWSGEAAVMAINAGVDFLLMPPNFESTFEFVVEAVQNGRIPMPQIDEAVRRILQAKVEIGLDRIPSANPAAAENILATAAHRQKAEEMANAAMTLVRDEKDALPFKAEHLDSVLVVAITDGNSGNTYRSRLQGEIRRRIPYVKSVVIDPRSTEEEVQSIIAAADTFPAVAAGVFVSWGGHKGSVSLPDTTVELLKDFFKIETPLAVISFGSPYILRAIPEAPSYICAYGTDPLAVRAATRAIFGEIPLNATLPVSIPGYYDIGDGLQKPAREMTFARNIDDTKFSEAHQILEQAIADSVFPGAQMAVLVDGVLIDSRGFGHQTYNANSPAVTTETIYDLASVTKVAATTVTAMELFEQNKIELDIHVKSYLPDFSGGLKDSVTLRHLLTHSAGLKAWDDLWNKAANKQEALDYIYDLPLIYTPGDSMIYSDLGIIMIGEIIETVTGKSIDKLAAQYIYRPMGMTSTMYRPPAELLPRIAPTEIGGGMNRGLIHGDVHDENTFFFNNVSTHAGLFSTAEDLAALAQMLLNGGIYNHRRFYAPQTISNWTTRQKLPEGTRRGIGWDTPADEESSAGNQFSKGSFGHFGYTGTSFWIDPNRKTAIVLLTNRVHPTRTRGGIKDVRIAFHNSVLMTLFPEAVEPEPEAETEVSE